MGLWPDQEGLSLKGKMGGVKGSAIIACLNSVTEDMHREEKETRFNP